jgi:hypothetical protein
MRSSVLYLQITWVIATKCWQSAERKMESLHRLDFESMDFCLPTFYLLDYFDDTVSNKDHRTRKTLDLALTALA